MSTVKGIAMPMAVSVGWEVGDKPSPDLLAHLSEKLDLCRKTPMLLTQVEHVVLHELVQRELRTRITS